MKYPKSLVGLNAGWLFLKVNTLEDIGFYNQYGRFYRVESNFCDIKNTKSLILEVLPKLKLYLAEASYSLPLINDILLDFFSSFIPFTIEESEFVKDLDTGRGIRFSATDNSRRSDVASVCYCLDITVDKYYELKRSMRSKVVPNTVKYINIQDPLRIINPGLIPSMPTMVMY